MKESVRSTVSAGGLRHLVGVDGCILGVSMGVSIQIVLREDRRVNAWQGHAAKVQLERQILFYFERGLKVGGCLPLLYAVLFWSALLECGARFPSVRKAQPRCGP